MRSGSAMADFASVFIANADSQDISVLALDRGDGALRLRGQIATEDQPRGFCIDPSGRWLLAVGQRSNARSVYAIDPTPGLLRAVSRLAVGRNPNWVCIV